MGNKCLLALEQICGLRAAEYNKRVTQIRWHDCCIFCCHVL